METGPERQEIRKEKVMARVTLPLLFKDFTGGERHAEVHGTSLAEVICELDKRYPGIQASLIVKGQLAPIVKVTIDGKLAVDGLASHVRPKSEVCLLPSMGGG